VKTAELLESKLQMGKYQIPYSWPNRVHRALERIYNWVWPELAKAIGVPARNIKYKGWSTEKGEFAIKISNPKAELDMIELMAPKALKGILEKVGFTDVKIEFQGTEISKATRTGKQYPILTIKFSSDYPRLWKDYDEQRFGTKVP
jgi:hypothetical protein